MGKFKMPTFQKFLSKKTIYGPKKDPVWVYLEREMVQNAAKKPYNAKVGWWLKFLKDLKIYYQREAKRKARRLNREVGPAWFCQLSGSQKEVLRGMKAVIHQDLLEDLPKRIRKCLSDLGLTVTIPKHILMKTMSESTEDPGVFIWDLYKALYKTPPSVLRGEYDMNAIILMSSLVFVDLEECIDELEKLTKSEKVTPVIKIPKIPKNTQPNIRYGEYLQKCHVRCFSTHGSGKTKKKLPQPIGCKVKLRSQESYERLVLDDTFLEKRKDRNKKALQPERVCNYKFWEPPSTLRNTDPKMVAYVNKLKMLKKRPVARFKAPYKNVQYQVGGIAFIRGKPQYILNAVSIMPSAYIPIHGGIANYVGQNITIISGFWLYPRDTRAKCEKSCDCLVKWESTAMQHMMNSKCRCGHLYDFYNEEKPKEKYFYPPTRHGGHWFDIAKIYQFDSAEDFVKDCIKDALLSKEPTPAPSAPNVSPAGLKEKVLLAAMLADLSNTPLLIPHLPEANLLRNLQEWVRLRVKGKISDTTHKQYLLQSERRWLDLKHMDFRARAYQIPFTLKQLHHMNWSQRHLVQKLFKELLNDFVSRNRVKQLEQSRLWWSTMKFDVYPSQAFLDIFFTYMPGRMKDTFLLNPYSSSQTPKYGAKTCPLGF